MTTGKPTHENDPEDSPDFIGPKQPKEPPKGDPANPYKDPGESKAGRGGIVSPGGTQPKPSEDPRGDSGLYDDPAATPKK
jgi:hypothetical protein